MKAKRKVPVTVAGARMELERLAMEKSFYAFCVGAWHVIETAKFKPNWHIKVICEHLEAVLFAKHATTGPEAGGPIRKLVINIPPRHMKSLIVSVFFPAWCWIHFPGKRFFYTSYSMDLSGDHADLTMQIITSSWFKTRWGKTGNKALDKGGYVELGRKKKSKHFTTSFNGARLASSVMGKITGAGGDILCTDDPHNVMQRQSEKIMSRVIVWWTKAMSTRGNDPMTFVRIVMMQRLGENDLAGWCISQGYSLLKIPARFEGQSEIGVLGHIDPRTENGELMWPIRFPEVAIAEMEKDLQDDAKGQLQQRPDSAGGQIIPVKEFRPYNDIILAQVLASGVDAWVMVWDFAVKGRSDRGKKRSYTVGEVWVKRGGDAFLVDQIRDQVDLLGQVEMVKTMHARWPKCLPILIEDKANGEPVRALIEQEIPAVSMVSPKGDKDMRAAAVAIFVKAGNVWIPEQDAADWVGQRGYEHGQMLAHRGSFLHECAMFPNGDNDDQVDCMSMALDYFYLGHWTPPLFEMGDDDREERPKVMIAKMRRQFAQRLAVVRAEGGEMSLEGSRTFTGGQYKPLDWMEDFFGDDD